MRKALLIFLSLVMGLVAWTAVWADDGFYVAAGQKANYAPVPKTGQTTPYGAGSDGDLKKGVPSPSPRFSDNGNGTVTDNLTGLIWMKNANAFGWRSLSQALSDATGLKSGDADLTDGSKAGDWRLPNVRELSSLIDFGNYSLALPTVHPFTNVQPSSYYWTSTTYAADTNRAWAIDFAFGKRTDLLKSNNQVVWCVRGGK